MSDGVFKAPKVKNLSDLVVKGEFEDDEESSQSSETLSPLPKKRRTAEDFFTFCNFILEYENYEAQKQESESSLVCSDDEQALSITNGIRTSLSIKELRAKNSSPLGSTGSSTESIKSESTSSISSLDDRKTNELEESGPGPGPMGGKSEDSWDLVTCYCLKPFAGRPMIECSECLTWIHLSCAKIRKSNIPEEFICQRCRDAKLTTRRSQRVRNEKRRISA